ncbi:GGDEF domain-containing protein [Shewanella sp. MF05960]|uniref:GGDEF domain-containing protein n=1 Tax=Shewanella sp. MF05960 TaxID=3434874 RepID=UPI003D79BD63
MLHRIELDKTYLLRRKVLIGTCCLLSIIGLFLGIFNLLRAEASPILATFELIYALLSLILMYRALNKRHQEWEVHLYVYSLTALIIFAIYIAELTNFRFCWALVIPILYFLMLGKKSATIPTSILLVLSVLDISVKSEMMFSSMLINFICSYLTVWIVSYVYETNRENSEKELQELALLDPLTQRYNRLALTKQFQKISTKPNASMYIMLLDLDYFKDINDNHGHEAGDIILQQCAEKISLIANHHYTFRIGGEEFCVIVEATELTQALVLAESIRQQISQHEFNFEDQILSITLSIGVTQFETEMTLSKALSQADAQLYEAKRLGRNRVSY